MLLKEPGFTLVAVVTLALGIGANTAMFSVVDGVLMRPLLYPEPDRLMTVWSAAREGDDVGDVDVVSPANFHDWKRESRSFSGLAASFGSNFNLAGVETAERIRGAEVTPNFFSVLGVDAEVGRTFSLGDIEEGQRTAVLGFALWQRRFGGDPEIVGATVTLNSELYDVVGVMPSWFRFGGPSRGGRTRDCEVWVRAPRGIPEPLGFEPEDLTAVRSLSYLRVMGRLAPGVTLAEARAEMDVIGRRLEEEYPDSNTNSGVVLVPLHEQTVGDVRPALVVLLCAVGFVMLIACANVANLLLARASRREREMAIRSSLGASRGRLIKQLLAESVLLFLLGGVLGLLVGLWGTELLLALEPGDLPRLSEVGLDVRILGFTVLVSIATGMLFGILPAFQGSRPNLQTSLKEGVGYSSGRGRRALSSFVVTEIGLALVLLVCAGLMIKSFYLLTTVDPGFETENKLTFRIRLPDAEYPEDAQMAAMYSRVLDRLRAVPGVQSAGGVLGVPLSNDIRGNFAIFVEGRPDPPPGEEFAPGYQSISPDYFRSMGVPLLEGRDFNSRDQAEAPPVVIVNQTMAQIVWPGESPLGKRISFDKEDWIEVVGLVGDVHHYGLGEQPRPELYLPYMQATLPFMTFVIRTASEPQSLTGAVRKEIRDLDPNLPVYGIATLRETLSESVARPRFHMILLGSFGALALVLATVGIYGLMAYSVSKSTREIGIRMALGARASVVRWLVLRRAMGLAVVGLVMGWIGALGFTRFLSSFLYQVVPADLAIFVWVSVLLAVVALVACLVPARKASRVQPVVALRLD